jgi:hypothetical protein
MHHVKPHSFVNALAWGGPSVCSSHAVASLQFVLYELCAHVETPADLPEGNVADNEVDFDHSARFNRDKEFNIHDRRTLHAVMSGKTVAIQSSNFIMGTDNMTTGTAGQTYKYKTSDTSILRESRNGEG